MRTEIGAKLQKVFNKNEELKKAIEYLKQVFNNAKTTIDEIKNELNELNNKATLKTDVYNNLLSYIRNSIYPDYDYVSEEKIFEDLFDAINGPAIDDPITKGLKLQAIVKTISDEIKESYKNVEISIGLRSDSAAFINVNNVPITYVILDDCLNSNSIDELKKGIEILTMSIKKSVESYLK